MRIKLDENLPVSLVATLARLLHDVDTVPSEGLKGAADPDVWEAAPRDQRFLQLAAALSWVEGRAKNRPFVTGDSALAEAAYLEGFTVIETPNSP